MGAQKVAMEDLVLLDQKDHKEIRVTLVLMAHLDPPEMMVNMEKEVLLVLKEKKENLVFKEVLVLEVHLVWRTKRKSRSSWFPWKSW